MRRLRTDSPIGSVNKRSGSGRRVEGKKKRKKKAYRIAVLRWVAEAFAVCTVAQPAVAIEPLCQRSRSRDEHKGELEELHGLVLSFGEDCLLCRRMLKGRQLWTFLVSAWREGDGDAGELNPPL